MGQPMQRRVLNLLLVGAACTWAPLRLPQAWAVPALAPRDDGPGDDGPGGEQRAGRQKVAVLELHDGGAVTEAEARYLSERLRGAALVLPVADWLVITRENILALLPPGTDLADCIADCEVTTGRNIGADVIVTGEFLRVGGRPRATLNAHRVDTGQLLAQEVVAVQRAADLEVAVVEAAERLFGQVSGQGTAAPEGTSWLRVEGPAGFLVQVDGIELGTLPMDVRSVPAGRHTISLTETDCSEAVAHVAVFEADFEHRLAFSPPRKTGEVVFAVFGPDGGAGRATISVDGDYRGGVPGTFELSPCDETLTFVSDDWYPDHTAKVRISDLDLRVGQRTYYQVRLQPPRPRRPAPPSPSPWASSARTGDDEDSGPGVKGAQVLMIVGGIIVLAGLLVLGIVPDDDPERSEDGTAKTPFNPSPERLAAGLIVTAVGAGLTVGGLLADGAGEDDSTARRAPSPGRTTGLSLGFRF